MTSPQYVLLSESTAVSDYVVNPVFTDVTNDGEIYTTYRIVRITHEIFEHSDGWTHLANVSLEFSIGIGVALLLIRNKIVEASRIKPTPPSELAP
jgi:hypothetical protein